MVDREVFNVLLEIKADVAETKQAVTDLAGPSGRVTALEKQAHTQKVINYVVMPFLLTAQGLARHFGVKI